MLKRLAPTAPKPLIPRRSAVVVRLGHRAQIRPCESQIRALFNRDDVVYGVGLEDPSARLAIIAFAERIGSELGFLQRDPVAVIATLRGAGPAAVYGSLSLGFGAARRG